MPIHDYKCDKCGHRDENLYFRIADIPKVRACGKCGKRASRQVFDTYGKAQVHHDHSGMYGKYHHGFGCVVRDYAHKKQLMKEYDVSEAADPVRGSRSWRDQMPENKQADTFKASEWMSKDEVETWMKGHKHGR